MMFRKLRSQKGLTLVETMVALSVFSIVALGITPLLLSSMRGAALSRSYNEGKNLGVEAMERIRGLPYFVSVQGLVTPQRRDVLDLYFPDLGAGYDAGTQTFTTTCTKTSQSPAANGALACPRNIPAGYTVTFKATFVKASGTSPTETYEKVQPTTGYNWNSTATELAPTQLLKMVVQVSWQRGGRDRDVSLTGLIGERTQSSEQVRGNAQIDYVISGSTGFTEDADDDDDDGDDGRTSHLEAIAGELESNVQTRTVSTADQSSRAARITLTEDEFNSDPAGTLADVSGATSTLHATPNVVTVPASDAGLPDPQVTHTELDGDPRVGYFGATTANTGTAIAQVLNELPTARGRFDFTSGTGQPRFWVNNPVGLRGVAELHLDPASAMLDVQRSGPVQLSGETAAVTTALSPTASRKVESTATARFAQLNLLPTSYILDLTSNKSVVSVEDFTASLTCRATANATPSLATGSWSATLKYWRDPSNDGIPAGAYVHVPISGSTTSTATDPLAAIKAAANPLVFDALDNDDDVYLFDTPTERGYLQDWWSRPQLTSTNDASGRDTSVNLDGALQIITAPVNPDDDASSISASVGGMSCKAVDKRGT
jgi:prepilin-type N-terminal cleavage/methylation domain-containing protein